MRNKIICVVQARVNSSRLPGKILLSIYNKSLLRHLLERLKKLKEIDDLFVATTKNKEDDLVSKIAKDTKVKIYRGDENNVLKRFYNCSKNNSSNIIIRITADCPLIDIKYVEELLYFFKNSNFDYVSNVGTNYLPDGFHCEIFSFKSLAKTYRLAKSRFDKEHVTSFIWSNPKLFSVYSYKGKKLKNYSKKVRLTIDYFEDYILIKKIFEKLYKKNKFFSLEKILSFLKKNNSLLQINKKYHNLQWTKYHSKREKYKKIQ